MKLSLQIKFRRIFSLAILLILLQLVLASTAYAYTVNYTNATINNGNTYTNSRNVQVLLDYDGDNGLNTNWWVRLGNTPDAVYSASWIAIPLQAYYTVDWTLDSGDGEKTVYVQYKRKSKWGTTYVVNDPNLYADTIILDTTAPTTGNIEIKNADQNGYDVYVYNVADAYSGVQTVKFPTWTDYNGQDDLIWHVGTDAGNGTWTYHVNRSDHKNESGQYYTHIYTYDNLGNSVYAGAANPVIPNLASNLSISQATSSTISASWNANGNPSGAAYNLVLQRPSDGVWLYNPEIQGTSYTFTGLSPNTQYNVWVRVRSSTGVWATSGYQLMGQPYTLANQPTSASWSNVDKTSLTLNWNKNSNSTNTSYRAVLTDPSTGTWLYNSNFQSDISSWTFSGLTPGKQYKGFVQARNSSSTETAWTDFGTKWTLPASPINISGTNDGLAWSTTAGTGYVTLSWPAITGSTGYKVHVFDGYSYRPFDVGNTTSWDSRTAKIYPSESSISSYNDNTVYSDLFNHSGTGLDLRDNPNNLYKKTADTTYDTSTNYWFRVTAYNSSGDSGIDWNYGYFPTLPNRTDAVAPSAPTISINPTAATIGTVIVTVNYSSDSNTKKYKIGTGAYLDYTGPFTVTSNATIYAKGQDLAGNWSTETSYTISNISSSAITFSPSTTSATFGAVTLTINYPSALTTKAYRIGSGTSQIYTGPIVLNSNATVYASGKDAQNNWTSEYNYTISNINAGPTFSTNTTAQTKSVILTIVYPAAASVKVYRMGSGLSQSYTGPITLSTNTTVYASAKDSMGNWSLETNYTITNIDNTPPTGDITINNGALKTTSKDVVLSISATDDIGTVSQMNISNDNFVTETGWITYSSANKNWTLSGTGTRNVYIKFKDSLGNESLVYSDDIMVSVIPTLNDPTVAGKAYLAQNLSVSSSGTNISTAAYRVYYTTQVTAPPTTDSSKWIDSGIAGSMNVTGTTDISAIITGNLYSNLIDKNVTTYLMVKVWVSSETGDSMQKYTLPFDLNMNSASLTESAINYVGHNQIIKVFGTSKEIVASKPNEIVETYGTGTAAELSENNFFMDGSFLKYRLEFDILQPSSIKDIQIQLDFNNMNSSGISLDVTKMKLQRLTYVNSTTWSTQDIATYTNSQYLKQSIPGITEYNIGNIIGRNIYSVSLKSNSAAIPAITSSGASRYALEYEAKLIEEPNSVFNDILIRNAAKIQLYTEDGIYGETLQDNRSGRKTFIDTRITRNVFYE